MPPGDPTAPKKKRRASSPRRPVLDFSLVGIAFVAVMLFMGLAAVNSQANLLFGVFGLMIGVLVVTWAISRFVLSRLEIRRLLPEYAEVGRQATLHYEFHNRKRFYPSLSVAVQELDGSAWFTRPPQAYLLHAAASTVATAPTTVVPARRGRCVLDRYVAHTSFPFGFIKRNAERKRRDTLLIHPPVGRVDPRLLARCLSAEQSGTRMKPRRGGADEFYGVREFRQGENPRMIYWRRSARTGTLVAKEMMQVAPPRLLIVLDTHLPERTALRHAEAERAIAMAATLASQAMEQGVAVGLCAWSGSWLVIMPSRGKRHTRELLAALSQLPLNESHRAEEVMSQARHAMRRGTTPILITPRPIEQSLGQSARGQAMAISSAGEAWRSGFEFDASIDFARCMPPDQDPEG